MKRVAGTTNINQHSDIGMKVGMGNVNVGLIYDPDELNDINLNIAYNNMSNRSEVDAWNYNLTNNIRSIFRNQKEKLITSWKYNYRRTERKSVQTKLQFANDFSHRNWDILSNLQ